jgi:hypothetical protein
VIKIKITGTGGYLLGDGECTFDPDKFLLFFMHKIMQAKMQGLTELGIPQEEIDMFLAQVDADNARQIAEASVIELKEYKQRKRMNDTIYKALEDIR